MHALTIATILFASPQLCATHSQTTEIVAAFQDPAADLKAEYEKRKKEAEGSVDKLWKLYEWCDTKALKNESKLTLRSILKLDDGSTEAHKLLGHVEYEGKWYESEKKVEEFKKKQLDAQAKELEAQAKALGKVIYKGEFVDEADIPFLEKGLTKDEFGRWIDLEAQKKLAAGWVRQDLAWIPPAEAGNVAKGLWKCGDKWMSIADADKFHSDVSRWWMIGNAHFIVYSTCPRKNVEEVLKQCEFAFRELKRVFGKTPSQAVPVIVLNSQEQYLAFAQGELGNTNPDSGGFVNTHGSFMGESYTDFLNSGQTLPGVAFWDAAKQGELWGPIFSRHAAGQAFGEALDQSPKAVAKLLKGDGLGTYSKAFWAEKQLPRWFRYGAATYVERYAANPLTAAGKDPFENRSWSVSNITRVGGLDPLDRIFQFDIQFDKKEEAEKLINEVGLMVAFALDGNCADVQKKLGALQEAIKKDKDISKAGQALADEIKKNEAKLRTFAAL